MAINDIYSINDLKTNFLGETENNHPLFFYYDEIADELMLMLGDKNKESVVHYVDEFVGLLFDPENLEIVGLQIEDFEKGFIPKFEYLEKIWKLSDFSKTNPNKNNFWELSLYVEQRQLGIALEIVKVSENIIGEPAGIFTKALQPA